MGRPPLVLMIFAGCIGEETDPSQAPSGPASFSEDTGAVEGVVTNEEGPPVAQDSAARVTQEAGIGLATTTGNAGRFSLSGVAPAQYTLFVQALGYEAAAQRVDVAADEILIRRRSRHAATRNAVRTEAPAAA